MADVFISYKRRIRPRVAELAEVLERLKVSVWFDVEIEPGKSFGAVINRELGDAKCVLVCWTPDAFAPEHGDDISWVEAEATMGRDRKVLVPVLLEQTLLNAPWNMLQTENLTEWTPGATPTGAWLGALAGIGKLVDRPGLADYVRASASSSADDLTRWAQTYPDDPLAAGVWERITELEVSAARERVMQSRTAKPAPTPAPAPPPRTTPWPQQAAPAQPQVAPQPVTATAPTPGQPRKLIWWQILVLILLFGLGGFFLLLDLAILLGIGLGSGSLAALIFYLVLGVPPIWLGFFLRRKWTRAA